VSVTKEILERARGTARNATPNLKERAAATIIDSILTAILGHTAPEIRHMLAECSEKDGPSSVFSLPSRRIGCATAAQMNALALCWYELDPGFRHAGCHVPLHVLPSLLAVTEAQGGTIDALIRHFIFGYEAVALLAMQWDTRPSGIHSHAVFSHLGAVIALSAAFEEDDAFIARALDLGSSTVNLGNAWEVSEGGALRNLWPALAACNAFSLYRAVKAGIGTAPERLEISFDRAFRRRDVSELHMRFSGSALGQAYGKLLPSCRHLHCSIFAALEIATAMPSLDIGAITVIEVTAHAEAAGLMSLNGNTLLNAQFSLPISISIALVSGRFDPEALLQLRTDPAVAALAQRVRIAEVHERAYPADRAASISISFADGLSITRSVDIAAGDPHGGGDLACFMRRKSALIHNALPPERRDRFLLANAALQEAFTRPETPIREALANLAGRQGEA
jgi:2-methylcitrate dehydratase PrpD